MERQGSAHETIGELPASLSDMTAVGENMVLETGRTLRRGLRKQPLEALLLAGAIGYLAGWAANRA